MSSKRPDLFENLAAKITVWQVLRLPIPPRGATQTGRLMRRFVGPPPWWHSPARRCRRGLAIGDAVRQTTELADRHRTSTLTLTANGRSGETVTSTPSGLKV